MKNLLILLSIILFSCNQYKPDYNSLIKKQEECISVMQFNSTLKNTYIKLLEERASLIPGNYPTENGSIKLRSYQFQIIDPEYALLYDGNKFIGKFKFSNTALDKLIMKDNL